NRLQQDVLERRPRWRERRSPRLRPECAFLLAKRSLVGDDIDVSRWWPAAVDPENMGTSRALTPSRHVRTETRSTSTALWWSSSCGHREPSVCCRAIIAHNPSGGRSGRGPLILLRAARVKRSACKRQLDPHRVRHTVSATAEDTPSIGSADFGT